MFNRQTFLAECQAAVQQADPVPLVEEIMTRAITLTAGDVYVMAPDAIHAIENPLPSANGALHVYGSNLQNKPGRSFWNPDTGREQPYDYDQVVRFSRLNKPQ